MALVLVEGESQIAAIINASNANSTSATNGATSQVAFDTHHFATMVAVTILGMVFVTLL